jgi:hypothetical protein
MQEGVRHPQIFEGGPSAGEIGWERFFCCLSMALHLRLLTLLTQVPSSEAEQLFRVFELRELFFGTQKIVASDASRIFWELIQF